ncbi:hypothetical protein UPYG_G00184030 [Umbra pygmaea]|uniref:GAS2-like protein 1 n=1 Tax=Umbra pygmaea TaxID=75934 RepID=A0ABD0XGF7_UMBPY
MADQSNIQSAASKSIRPFKSSEEYLYAMKEDLAEWFNTLYDLDISADTFMEGLETGCALCRHANNVNRAALDFQLEYPEAAKSMRMPTKDVVFQSRNVIPGSFLARDNVSNFISWCRQELWIKDVLMFETNDIVEKCNEKNFVLCLLEVARRGAKFGMLAPMLIQLEEEIEEEIRDQENLGEPSPSLLPISRAFVRKESVVDEPEPAPYAQWQQKQRVLCDMRNLDELVREILGRCSCPAQFPMTKVSEGKYKVGDSSALIFIRVLRTHVMVRVGGGWDTLEHYLDKHDPCRCAAFAHRYHQSKASGQGAHSKSSSAHSSRSTSPGPHWRNEGIAPYKPPDRPPCATSSSGRPGRSHLPSLPADVQANAGRAPLLPRPPRDRSEPRHFNPLRSKESSLLPVTRRLSGDSDSSTASSRGGGTGGGRFSLGGTRQSGEEVVLLVNRKEGKHVIERPGEGGGQIPALHPPMPRGRSHSRERPGPASILKPSPPQGPSDGTRANRVDRGCSLGPEGPRRLQVPRSHSQGKLPSRSRASDASPGPSARHGASQLPFSDKREELRTKHLPPTSPRNTGGFTRRQSSSCSNSPIKGVQSSSPSKKTMVAPRPPGPRSPSMGKSRMLPPVSQAGRRSPHSSSLPRSSHHHHNGPRSPRTSHSPRANSHKGWPTSEHLEPEEEGLGYHFQMLPSLDPQREQDLYRSFEAEFLANTGQARDGPSTGAGGVPLQLSPSSHPQQGLSTQTLPTPAPADCNITDSAYSSSNSSTSSVTVGGKMGALLDLRESKRSNPHSCGGPKEPLPPLHGHSPGRLSNGGYAEPEHWGGRGGGLRKLPAISSSAEDGEILSSRSGQRDSELGISLSSVPSQYPFHPGSINGGHVGGASAELLMESQQGELSWGSGPEGDVPLENQQPSFPYRLDDEDPNDDLPPAESCPSPIPLPPSEDCSFQDDSSSESSSMCFSLSESRSESSPPPPRLANGDDADGSVVFRPKRVGKKSDRVPPLYKLKLKPRIRPRTDNRPENSPSRIPTPVSYRDVQAGGSLNTLHTPTPPQSPQSSHSNGHPASRKAMHQAFADLIHPHSRSPAIGSRERTYSVESGSGLDTEAWM